MLHSLISIFATHVSPTLNRSFVLQCFKCGWSTQRNITFWLLSRTATCAKWLKLNTENTLQGMSFRGWLWCSKGIWNMQWSNVPDFGSPTQVQWHNIFLQLQQIFQSKEVLIYHNMTALFLGCHRRLVSSGDQLKKFTLHFVPKRCSNMTESEFYCSILVLSVCAFSVCLQLRFLKQWINTYKDLVRCM